MTRSDPSRSPRGTEAAWAYTHVPHKITADAGDQGITGNWHPDARNRMADRVEEQVERFAPGFRALIRARRVLAPPTLQELDANLMNGALNSGTTALHQQLVFRPVPGLGRPETPVGACSSPLPAPTRAAACTAPPAPTPPSAATSHPAWPAPNASSTPATAPAESPEKPSTEKELTVLRHPRTYGRPREQTPEENASTHRRGRWPWAAVRSKTARW